MVCLRRLMTLSLLAAVGAAGAVRSAEDSRPLSLRIAAAADLKFALDDVVAGYRAKAPATQVLVTYGSSGNFFAQISNGAPFDLYLSADIEYPRKLVEAGLALKGSEFSYAIGRLVVWVPASSKLDVLQLRMKTLLAPSVRTVAIANPRHAPYGRAAVAAMRSLGVYGAVSGKLVLGESVAQAAQFVHSGNADVGVLPLSLALSPTLRRDGHFWQVPETAHPRIDQGGVVVASSTHPAAAKAFAAYLTGPEGRAILETFGFRLPREPHGR